ACAAGAGDGAWAEYMVAPALQCSPLPKSVSDEQGAMRIVNPYTAWAHLTIARQAGARAIVQTAAASALGQMVNRLAQQRRVQVIDLVRRYGAAEPPRVLGARYILTGEAPDFDSQLGARCRQLAARLAFDGGAGTMPARLLNALPPEGRVVVYGGLAGEPIT